MKHKKTPQAFLKETQTRKWEEMHKVAQNPMNFLTSNSVTNCELSFFCFQICFFSWCASYVPEGILFLTWISYLIPFPKFLHSLLSQPFRESLCLASHFHMPLTVPPFRIQRHISWPHVTAANDPEKLRSPGNLWNRSCLWSSRRRSLQGLYRRITEQNSHRRALYSCLPSHSHTHTSRRWLGIQRRSKYLLTVFPYIRLSFRIRGILYTGLILAKRFGEGVLCPQIQ